MKYTTHSDQEAINYQNMTNNQWKAEQRKQWRIKGESRCMDCGSWLVHKKGKETFCPIHKEKYSC